MDNSKRNFYCRSLTNNDFRFVQKSSLISGLKTNMGHLQKIIKKVTDL